jgi:hypothetical protein
MTDKKPQQVNHLHRPEIGVDIALKYSQREDGSFYAKIVLSNSGDKPDVPLIEASRKTLDVWEAKLNEVINREPRADRTTKVQRETAGEGAGKASINGEIKAESGELEHLATGKISGGVSASGEVSGKISHSSKSEVVPGGENLPSLKARNDAERMLNRQMDSLYGRWTQSVIDEGGKYMKTKDGTELFVTAEAAKEYKKNHEPNAKQTLFEKAAETLGKLNQHHGQKNHENIAPSIKEGANKLSKPDHHAYPAAHGQEHDKGLFNLPKNAGGHFKKSHKTSDAGNHSSEQVANGLDSPTHPYHKMYTDALGKLEQMSPRPGGDPAPQELAGALVHSAANAKFDPAKPIEIVAGTKENTLFAVQGELTSPASKSAMIDTANLKPPTTEQVAQMQPPAQPEPQQVAALDRASPVRG